MSELRIKLLELAIQGGATIDNAERVATDWENWAADAHPLKLGTPSPKPCEHEFEWDCLMVGCECAPKPVEPEIDWDFKGDQYLTHTPSGITFAYAGKHEEGGFYGTRLGSGCWGWVSKNGFRRGAGLHDESKNPGNSEREIDWSRPQLVTCSSGMVVQTTGKHAGCSFEGVVVGSGRFREVGEFITGLTKLNFTYHGEIPAEPKTTGLNFLEAMEATLNGFTVRRPDNAWYLFDPEQLCVKMSTGRGGLIFPVIYQDDILATDWQIIPK